MSGHQDLKLILEKLKAVETSMLDTDMSLQEYLLRLDDASNIYQEVKQSFFQRAFHVSQVVCGAQDALIEVPFNQN